MFLLPCKRYLLLKKLRIECMNHPLRTQKRNHNVEKITVYQNINKTKS